MKDALRVLPPDVAKMRRFNQFQGMIYRGAVNSFCLAMGRCDALPMDLVNCCVQLMVGAASDLLPITYPDPPLRDPHRLERDAAHVRT